MNYSLNQKHPHITIDYEKELNQDQLSVVNHPGGPMLVLAGAGTGKTRTVTYRVARLLETNVNPENILLLTFTNKAAKEMMQRVDCLIERDIHGLWGGTFHHIGNIILRINGSLIGVRKGFLILDREDSKDLFSQCLAETKKQDMVFPRSPVLCKIYSLMQNRESSAEEIITSAFPRFESTVDEIRILFGEYEKKKYALNLVDFDDLLTQWKRLLLEHEHVRDRYAAKFQHILVDEYQDTNKIQAEIVDLLSGQHRNLMVVGDDAQSIYSFRGADFDNILRFPERYPDAEVFSLTTNYRSTPEILQLANECITNNIKQFQKDLSSVKKTSGLPYLVAARDVYHQADFIARDILSKNKEGVLLNDMAVLYRSHFQSMEMQMELQRSGIPFEVRSGLKFFEHAHIKDVLAFLRVMLNPLDELSWKRLFMMLPGIGKVTARKLYDAISASKDPLRSLAGMAVRVPKKARDGFHLFVSLLESMSQGEDVQAPQDMIEYILTQLYADYLYTHYPDARERIQDIEQVAQFAQKYSSLDMFVNDMNLLGISGEGPGEYGDNEHVVLSTVHQAKGLEWKHVFIIGLNEGWFPALRSLREDYVEEERRLFYVAATRAKEQLYLCFPVISEDWYSLGSLKPSRFIQELPQNVYEEILIDSSD